MVTNVELDHPDEFVDADDVRSAFVGFLDRLREGGTAVVCADDAGAMAVAAATDRPVVTYGTTPGADVRLEVGASGSS